MGDPPPKENPSSHVSDTRGSPPDPRSQALTGQHVGPASSTFYTTQGAASAALPDGLAVQSVALDHAFGTSGVFLGGPRAKLLPRRPSPTATAGWAERLRRRAEASRDAPLGRTDGTKGPAQGSRVVGRRRSVEPTADSTLQRRPLRRAQRPANAHHPIGGFKSYQLTTATLTIKMTSGQWRMTLGGVSSSQTC